MRPGSSGSTCAPRRGTRADGRRGLLDAGEELCAVAESGGGTLSAGSVVVRGRGALLDVGEGLCAVAESGGRTFVRRFCVRPPAVVGGGTQLWGRNAGALLNQGGRTLSAGSVVVRGRGGLLDAGEKLCAATESGGGTFVRRFCAHPRREERHNPGGHPEHGKDTEPQIRPFTSGVTPDTVGTGK